MFFVFIYFASRSYVLLDKQGKKMNASSQLESGKLYHNTALSVRHIALFFTVLPRNYSSGVDACSAIDFSVPEESDVGFCMDSVGFYIFLGNKMKEP